MNKIKVQFIGITDIPKQKDDEFLRVRKCNWEDNKGYSCIENLSFHDYHIVFINYPFQYEYPKEPTGFLDYLSGGGISIVFLGPSNHYPWDVKSLKILSGQSGDTIQYNPNHWLKTIFKRYQFKWYCFIEKGEHIIILESFMEMNRMIKESGGKTSNPTELFQITGTTISGKCVSAVVHFGAGKLILLPLPLPAPSKDLIRDLLDGVKNNYLPNNQVVSVKPQWIDKYRLQPEQKLLDEANNIADKFGKIKQQLDYYDSIKKILYTYDKELTNSIYLILKEIGLDPKLTEREGRQDIEIKHNSFFAIIEVKGLKGYANNENLRQLLEWYTQTVESNPKVKAIFIVNHFRDTDLTKRENPFTTAALRIAKDNGFCLLTTVDLFNLYSQFINKEIQTEQIRDKLLNTKGLLVL